MRDRAFLVLCGILVSGTLFAQVPQLATVILGAGRAGSWDTRIAVTNFDPHPIHVIVTAQPDRSACGVSTCNDFAETTIAAQATFVLASIPDPLQPGFSNAPQAVYVLSPSDQNAPAVS